MPPRPITRSIRVVEPRETYEPVKMRRCRVCGRVHHNQQTACTRMLRLPRSA